MNGFIRKTMAGLCLGAGLASLGGCYCYRQLVDPCWPERYSFQSRHAVADTFNAQANNGHVLDQTIWNHYFETDPKTGAPTDRLNAAGQERLLYLVRRRPVADPKVYLQTAQDIPGVATMPLEKFAPIRADLDSKRSQAVRNFLANAQSGRVQAVAFEVAVHDPAPVGIQALPIAGAARPNPTGAVPDLYTQFKGSVPLTTSGGGTGGGGGGSSGGGGGGR